jgi:hypothetical protein
LVGRRSGRVFQIGDEVSVRLVETDAIGGRVVFQIQADAPAPISRLGPGIGVDLRWPGRTRSGRRR